MLERKEQLQNKPEEIVAAIEKFAGRDTRKSTFIREELHKIKPQVVVEIGAYVGYTAVIVALELEKMGSRAVVHSFDVSQEYCDITRQVTELAGLAHRVQLHQGTPEQLVEGWQKAHILEKVNFILLNHNEAFYLSDLRAIESLGLINPGTTVIADDYRGEYLQYVESTPVWKKEYNEQHRNRNGVRFTGKWGIVYDNCFKGDGQTGNALVVSKCLQVLF